MLNSHNNDNGIKKSIGLISKEKKTTLHTQHTFICALLCHCLPRLQHGTSRNFLTVYTCFIEEIHFFPLLLISTLVAISICHFLTATKTHLQWHAGLACLEIRSRNEEAINSTRNMIYSLKVFYFLLYRRRYFLFVSELI